MFDYDNNAVKTHRVGFIEAKHAPADKKPVWDDDEMEHAMNIKYPKEYRTIPIAARYFGISEYKLRMMKKNRQLPCIYSGNRALVCMEALKKMLEDEALSQVTLPGLEGKSVLPNG